MPSGVRYLTGHPHTTQEDFCSPNIVLLFQAKQNKQRARMFKEEMFPVQLKSNWHMMAAEGERVIVLVEAVPEKLPCSAIRFYTCTQLVIRAV